MLSPAFELDRSAAFISAAAQQTNKPLTSDVDLANAACGCTDTPHVYAARGVVYGLLISAPLWVIIGGAVFLACKMIG